MKVLVQFSGGKDSHASLIWSVKKFGKKAVTAVFCDTFWDAQTTYDHIENTCKLLDVPLKIVTSKKYSSFEDMVIKKGIAPTALRRFCTTDLKVNPFIDYLLEEIKENVIIVQGIRALESEKRAKMSKECTFFRYYFEPYTINKRGDKVYFNYRKKEIAEWVKKYDDSVFRPVFEWTGQQVIDYIKENDHKPNELYYMGFKRVGCFPCIMSTMVELKEMATRFPERMQRIIDFEDKTGITFFPYNYLPEWARTGIKTNKRGKTVKVSTAKDIFKYVLEKHNQPTLFNDGKTPSCSSFFHLCE